MKRIIVFLCAVFMLMGITVHASEDGIYADALKDGSYNIEVSSSSSMFRIVDCELIVSDGEMSAVMTLSGTGYEKLFMGTGEEALTAPDEDCIYFVEDNEGMYTYTVPVEALDTEIDCAAWSIRKQQWYDRTLVFESAGLPEEAFKGWINTGLIVGIPAVLIIIAAVIFIKKRS